MAVFVGFLAGTHTSTWGMYKDAPHEGFTVGTYVRSMIVGTLAAPVLMWITGVSPMTPGGFVVLWATTYCTERGLVELWKTFLRDVDQSKFTIPMQFHVFGRVIPQGPTRWLIAAAHVAAVLLLLWFIGSLNGKDLGMPHWVAVLLIGSIGGWFSAFGGAFKDAPIEGFSPFKFVRSPGLAAAWALLLSHFTDDYVLMSFGGLGMTIATIETYKTFFFPSKPRGKFANKPITHPQYLEMRKRFVPVYVAIWAIVIAAIVMGFRS